MNSQHSSIDFLLTLQSVIRDRMAQNDANSYTASLLASGTKRIAQKVGEEGVEVALAAVGGSVEELRDESADLLYHVLVLLAERGLSLEEVCAELERRHA
jgi:phosphoribosyl-ATP pyrophosphohydrolase/phosphoribosyl-AMP cyclohydrolase